MSLNTLMAMLEDKKYLELKDMLFSMQAADVAEYIEELEEDKQVIVVFRLLTKEIATEVFVLLSVEKQTAICSLIDDSELKAIVDDLYFDDKIDLLEEVPAYLVKRIMLQRGEKERHLINQFLNYKDNTAGTLMTIEFVDLHKEMTVREAMRRIKRDAMDKETVYNCYVMDGERHLDGIVSLKDIIISDDDMLIEDIMVEQPTAVTTGDDQEMVADLFQKYDLLALPVTDTENRLVGIITIDDIMDVMEEEATEDILKMSAVTPTQESYLDMGPLKLAKARVPWLMILMISATITSFIITSFESALESVVILAAYIPMLMDTGGNAGSQVCNTIIRALTLGDVRFKDLLRVIFKELRTSALCGLMLAVVNFGRLMLLSKERDLMISLTVSSTLFCTVMFAQVIGGVLPILADKLGADPALMASPLITTIVDAAGLLLYFTFASILLGI